MSGFGIISERYCGGFCNKRLANGSVKKLKLSESRAQRGRVFQFQRNELSAYQKSPHLERKWSQNHGSLFIGHKSVKFSLEKRRNHGI
jgi:hypothetical protein